MSEQFTYPDKILRRVAVEDLTGLSKATIYDKLNKKSPRYDPLFPVPIKLGAGAVGWSAAELFVWIEHKKEARS